jgi:hypothetical protein
MSTLREQLIGAWTLVYYIEKPVDGSKIVHVGFLNSVMTYEKKYVEYWNGKVKDLRRQSRRIWTMKREPDSCLRASLTTIKSMSYLDTFCPSLSVCDEFG